MQVVMIQEAVTVKHEDPNKRGDNAKRCAEYLIMVSLEEHEESVRMKKRCKRNRAKIAEAFETHTAYSTIKS
jgi:hypothetical protein